MGILGIDVGTTGCKAIVFLEDGTIASRAYEEYDILVPEPHRAELDSRDVWNRIWRTIGRAAAGTREPIAALSVTSMGEAVVPVSKDRCILGPSILNVDIRGEEFLPELSAGATPKEFYRRTGNTLENQYGLTKLMWIRAHDSDLYRQTDYFLNWAGFVSFMLGAAPVVDYSLANRSLLFDIEHERWSEELLSLSGIDAEKLPQTVPSGTVTGSVSRAVAAELGLSPDTRIVSGAHDQCASAVGAGAIAEGSAMYGMGTFPTIMPVYAKRKDPDQMIALGLNTEHHAVPGLFGSFIYHMGGSAVKWFRNAMTGGASADYESLFDEMPAEPAGLLVMPHFAPMGPPDYIADSAAAIVGLTTEAERGEILRGIEEGNIFEHRMVVDQLPAAGISIRLLRAVGGGSRSEKTLQLTADVLNLPVVRPHVDEAGALGAALLAGTGTGVYPSLRDAVDATVHVDRTFEPNLKNTAHYDEAFGMYRELRTMMVPFVRRWNGLVEKRR